MNKLIMPEFTWEQQREFYKNIKSGTKLHFVYRNNWRNTYSIGEVEVIRITPKGKIRLSDNELLDIEKYSYSQYLPQTEIYNQWVNDYTRNVNIIRNNKILAENVLVDIRPNQVNYELMLKLELILKEIKENLNNECDN